MLRSVNLTQFLKILLAKKTLQLTVVKMERRKQKLTKRQLKIYGLRPWNVLDSQAREIVMKGRESRRKKGKVAAMR